jgi:hypothetical protein
MQSMHNDGFKSICRALRQNFTLIKLSVVGDRIWDAAPIANMLRENVTLEYLNLEHNEFDDDAAVLLEGTRK